MDKTGRILLTAQEESFFKATGQVPPRIKETWGIHDPVELSAHIRLGLSETLPVITGDSKNE
jgi:hypothetical protein